MMQLTTKSVDQVSQGAASQPMQIGSAFEDSALKDTAVDSTYGSRTEKVINKFLENPLLKGGGRGLDEVGNQQHGMHWQNRVNSEICILKVGGTIQFNSMFASSIAKTFSKFVSVKNIGNK